MHAQSQDRQVGSGQPTDGAAQGAEVQQPAAVAEDAPAPAVEAPPALAAAFIEPAAVAPAAPAVAPAGDDFREVDFDALLGLQGPLLGLFENAAMIVLLAATMLFAAFLLPFTVGRCAFLLWAPAKEDRTLYSYAI